MRANICLCYIIVCAILLPAGEDWTYIYREMYREGKRRIVRVMSATCALFSTGNYAKCDVKNYYS